MVRPNTIRNYGIQSAGGIPFFSCRTPHFHGEAHELTQLTAASCGASSTGLPDIAALIIRAPSKGCPAHVDVVQLLLDKGVERGG